MKWPIRLVTLKVAFDHFGSKMPNEIHLGKLLLGFLKTVSIRGDSSLQLERHFALEIGSQVSLQ